MSDNIHDWNRWIPIVQRLGAKAKKLRENNNLSKGEIVKRIQVSLGVSGQDQRWLIALQRFEKGEPNRPGRSTNLRDILACLPRPDVLGLDLGKDGEHLFQILDGESNVAVISGSGISGLATKYDTEARGALTVLLVETASESAAYEGSEYGFAYPSDDMQPLIWKGDTVWVHATKPPEIGKEMVLEPPNPRTNNIRFVCFLVEITKTHWVVAKAVSPEFHISLPVADWPTAKKIAGIERK